MKKKYLIISTICLLLSGGIGAQVTIGNSQPPLAGALLELKQESDGTSKKGMMLPRVELTDVAKLKMGTNEILDTDNGGNQFVKHTGLWVYNISGAPIPNCAPIPDGLYVWDGAKWNGITVAKVDPASLDVGTKTTFDLPSGRDARPLTAESFTVGWTPVKPLPYTNTPHATWDGITFSNITANPLTRSPATFSMTPDAMTIANENLPWQSKESTLTFDAADDCNRTVSKTITLNQTNYALKVNNQFSNSQIVYGTFAVQGNVTWTTSKTDANNILSTTTPAIGAPAGETKKDGTTVTLVPNFSYTTAAGTRYQTADITFKDTESIKRFDDITVSILNCNTADNDPSLNDWALRAGFTQVQINNVATGGTHATTQANGIQLHKDQSGNIFLSGRFGYEDAPTNTIERRWMLNNLAATTYAPGKPHSQGRALTPSYADAYNAANYGYPNLHENKTNTATLYNANPRLGLLYNWDAATGGKGGLAGTTSITDGEIAGNANDPQTTQVQGICPNGWHLPSDWEYTQLENELNTHTSSYSGIADANGTITVAGRGARGNNHGQGMKDSCPTPGQTTSPTSGGASNVTSTTVAPGFSSLLAGYGYGAHANHYGNFGCFWSASGDGTAYAWYRAFSSGFSHVNRFDNIRFYLFSVRCKK